MEMPRNQMPRLRDLAIGLWQRARVFQRRTGTIIFVATIALWVLLSFPQAETGESQLDASVVRMIADGLHPILGPIGFNREISLACIPALAAREVAVSALARTYAVEAENEELAAQSVTERIADLRTLPTALAFLAWFVFARQCLSTLAAARSETYGWKWPIFMVVYLFALAYFFAGLTYWGALALGW